MNQIEEGFELVVGMLERKKYARRGFVKEEWVKKGTNIRNQNGFTVE
jgi:hypothetical protein